LKYALILGLLLALIVWTEGCSKKAIESQEGILEGTATFEGQQNHTGIKIELRQLGRQATTTADGSYRFSSVPSGTYTLLITDADTIRHLFDFAMVEGISVTKDRKTTVPHVELPLFQRIETDLHGQVNWTEEGGPYLITQNVTVSSGSRLSIEPGTTVKFAGYYRLNILGRFLAKGTVTDSILFTTMDLEGIPGSWDRLSIQGPKEGPPDTLSFCRIQYANVGLSCQQVSPAILNSEFQYCFGYGMVIDFSNPQISGNLLQNNYGGISCENTANPIISDNLCRNNTYAGISCNNSAPQIDNNIILQNSSGLYLENGSHPVVMHNQLDSNEDGLYLHYYCNPLIEANEVTSQQVHGIYLSGYNNPMIHFNNIVENDGYNIFLTYQPDDVHAQNNWWGTDNLNEIGALIWDIHDNASLGEALITPILTSPVDSAGLISFP
jgi:parallel beta-helix repeat protein